MADENKNDGGEKGKDGNGGEKDTNTSLPWRAQAKKDGFSFLPQDELEELQKNDRTLKDIRSKIPEEFRDKEDEFFSTAENAIKTVKEGGDPNVEAVKSDLSSTKRKLTSAEKEKTNLTSENEGLKKENKRLTIWGYIGREQQNRNVWVSDRLINEADIDSVNLEDFDLSSDDGRKQLGEHVWKNILESAHEEQTRISRAGGPSSSGGRSTKEGKEGEDDKKDGKIPTFGSLA